MSLADRIVVMNAGGDSAGWGAPEGPFYETPVDLVFVANFCGLARDEFIQRRDRGPGFFFFARPGAGRSSLPTF